MKRLLTWFLVACSMAGSVAAADLVKLEGDVVRHLHPQGAKAAARIPVQTERDVPFDALTFKLVSVRRGNDETPGLIASFGVEAQAATAGQAAAVIVSADSTLMAGTYDVQLEVQRNVPLQVQGSQPRETQRLELKVVRPASQLSPPGTLKVKRVLPFIFGLPMLQGVTRQQPLVLHETSKDSAVGDIKITMLSRNAADGGPVAGAITFTPPAEVPAGGLGAVEYELTGDFDLGDANVKASLDAPQLANAIVVDFSIATRRHPALVVVLLAAGLLVGYLLRTRLQSSIELGAAKEQAGLALDELEEAVLTRADTSFCASLNAQVTKLRAAVQLGKASEIARIAGEVGGEIQNAVTDLQKREVEVRQLLDGLLTLVTKHWTLPPEAEGALRVAREAAREADDNFDMGNPEPTRTACETIRSDVLATIVTSARFWRDETRKDLRAMENSAAPLIQRLRNAPNEFDGLKAAISAVPVDDPDAVLQDLVEKTHHARVLQLDATGQLLEVLRALLQKWTSSLAEFQVTLDALSQQVKSFWGKVEESSAGADGIIDLLLENAETLHQSLAAAILEAAPGNDDDLNTHLAAGKYEEAIERADQLRRARTQTEGQNLGKTPVEEIEAADLGLAPAPQQQRVAPGSGVVSRHGSPWPGLRVQLDRGRTMRQVMWDKAMQTIIYAVLIIFGGYALFAGNFVGTFDDCAMIFFWGFGIDLGAEAITTLATQIKANR